MPIVKAAAPVRPTAVVNTGAIQDTAAAAQAAALKMLEGAVIDDSAAPVEEGDKAAKAAPVAEEAAPEEGEEVEVEAPKEEEKPAPKEGKKEALPDPLRKSFEALALEKKAMRDERDKYKSEMAELSRFRAIDVAAKNRDALGVLAAHGLSFKDVNLQVAGGADPTDLPEDKQEAKSPLEERLAALETTLQKERFQRHMDNLQGQMAKAVDAKKYPTIAAEPELVADAHKLLIDHTRQTGSPPGSNLNESMHMALEAIEAREQAANEKYRKRLGLTTSKNLTDTEVAASKSAVEPASGLGTSRTISNSHASAPKAAGSTKAETVEELRAKALRQLNGEA